MGTDLTDFSMEYTFSPKKSVYGVCKESYVWYYRCVCSNVLTDMPMTPNPANITLGQSWVKIPFGTNSIAKKHKAVNNCEHPMVQRRPYLPTTKTQRSVPGIAIKPLTPTVKNKLLPTWPKY